MRRYSQRRALRLNIGAASPLSNESAEWRGECRVGYKKVCPRSPQPGESHLHCSVRSAPGCRNVVSTSKASNSVLQLRFRNLHRKSLEVLEWTSWSRSSCLEAPMCVAGVFVHVKNVNFPLQRGIPSIQTAALPNRGDQQRSGKPQLSIADRSEKNPNQNIKGTGMQRVKCTVRSQLRRAKRTWHPSFIKWLASFDKKAVGLIYWGFSKATRKLVTTSKWGKWGLIKRTARWIINVIVH